MDTVVKKSNKENSKLDAGPKKPKSINVPLKSAPLQSKNGRREEHTEGKSEQVKPLKPAHGSVPAQRKTLSQAFRTEQSLRHRKMVLEAQKPPSSVPPKPLLPGTYKGRMVQSKIDCFRKPQSGHEKKLSENEMSTSSSIGGGRASVASRTKPGSEAQVNMQKPVLQKRTQTKATVSTAAMFPKPSTVSAKPSTKPITIYTKPPTSSTKPFTSSTKPPTASTKPPTASTKPPTASTKPFTASTKPPTVIAKPSTISKKAVTMSARPPAVTSFIKKKEQLKPAVGASEQKPKKTVSSSISQYRVRVETAEEKQLKLAEWLALKGKTLKRPAMSQSCKPEHGDEIRGAEMVRVNETKQSKFPHEKLVFSDSPSHILNTTLDLLDSSDTELHTEPEIRMESVVINLCERLEAMETPSSCETGPHVKTGGSVNAQVKVEEEIADYEIVEEENLSEERPMDTAGAEKKEEDGEEEKTLKVKMEEEKVYGGDEDEEEKDSTPADVVEACVVKYSVKTTPFLQSVKKRMEAELALGTPGSRHKSSIKDLRFLTPVRRSSRIQRNSSRLPDMLNEHDPCVSSLAELELLDTADSNAYIYRKNPALLQHLPDQHPEPQSCELTCT